MYDKDTWEPWDNVFNLIAKDIIKLSKVNYWDAMHGIILAIYYELKSEYESLCNARKTICG